MIIYYLHTLKNPIAAKNIARLIENDSKTIYELSTEKEIEIKTISLLWQFLTNRITDEETSVDLWLVYTNSSYASIMFPTTFRMKNRYVNG